MFRLATFVALCVALSSAEARAELAVGDVVKLVVRDNHIPGHPGDRDRHVSIRFQSGSTATVEEIGTWVKVSGLSTTGDTGSGWIVKKYIASEAGQPDITSPELAWCPAKGSPEKHVSGRIRIATWNIATLHRKDGEQIFPGSSAARQPVDYDRIRCYSRLLDADIIAVQEIDGLEALSRVVDTDVYDLHMSGRDAHQNTGFAFKKQLAVTPQPDFDDLDVGDVRHGARIDLTHNGKTLKLMSVHLKSGCFSNSNSSSSSACRKLQRQVPILESWIDREAAASGDGFIVLGDFNRRLVEEDDLVWDQLDDGAPPNAGLVAATENMPISCRDNRFTEFIDHIVLDKRAARWLEPSSFRHVTYRQQDKEVWDLISDHCPVVVELWIK